MAAIERFLDASTLRIRDDEGADIGAAISSMRFNATARAYELRAPRLESTAQSSFPVSMKSPLHVFAMGAPMMLIYFDAVEIIPVEVDLDTLTIRIEEGTGRKSFTRATHVNEVAILHGARIERL